VNLTCEELVELLLDYLDESLPPEQVVAIKAHLCDCPPCVQFIDTYQITVRISRSLPKTAPLPPAVEERLRAALADHLLGEK
jgi:hypothetical protein